MAQINGEGGGFGLSVKLTPDGSVLTSFLLDADVFAVMSRATGVSSKVHPLVVKNGSVYMNHAMMDTAEIGNVIAKYINVQHLKGTLIESGSFRGGDLWLGENANGQFGAYGKNWNAGIDSNGRFYGSDVYFSSGTFQGNVLANSGTMNNVTIRENCQILGKLNVNQLEGDVVRVYAMQNEQYINVTALGRARLVVFAITVCSGNSWTQCDIYVGASRVKSVKATVIAVAGGMSISAYTAMETHSISVPAGTTAAIKFVKSAGNAESYNTPGAVGVLMIDAQS